MFPSDDVLIARGKYSTLSHERRAQIQRVQKVCTNLITLSNQILTDAQKTPPESAEPLVSLEKCLASLKDARGKIVDLTSEMLALKGVAWDEQDE